MRPKIRRIRARPAPPRATQSGIVLPYALFVVILILILGLAFMQTSATESLANIRSEQRLQAAAAAEYGIARARAMADSTGNNHGYWYAMTYNGSNLSWAASASYGGHQVATLFSNQTVPAYTGATYTVVVQDLTNNVATSGIYRIHSYGTVGAYTRHVSIDSQALNFASFGWLTNTENGVWFITGDSLSGLIWSNGQFNIDGNPTFNGAAYTGSATLNYMNGGPPNDNPAFNDGITYNAPTLNISTVMSGSDITAIQSSANSGGILKPSNSGNGYSLIFNSNGTFTLYGMDSSGNEVSPALISNQAISTTNGAFYFQDNVSVSGTINGAVTIATSSGNDIDIANNLVYSYPANITTWTTAQFNNSTAPFTTGFNPNDTSFTSKCALVSGGNLVINPGTWSSTLTTPWNGGSKYYKYTGGWPGTDMYVTATCASVTGSFENADYTSSPQKTLHVYGGIAQITRGAVGQTGGWNGATGFVKDYVYDTRFLTSPPPVLSSMSIGSTFSNWQLY